MISTVGPYINYGEPLVAACAAAGTSYVDLTGEPEFVDEMWLRYHEQAERTGARLVHSCGFDSIPYDLGALFAVDHLPEGVPIKLEGFVRVGGKPSGGTFHSAFTSWPGCARAPGWRANAASASPAPMAVRSAGSPAGRTATRPPADGWSRSRRSTRRRCCARPAPSTATAPTSATATTW